jgi:hypothetical protein
MRSITFDCWTNQTAKEKTLTGIYYNTLIKQDHYKTLQETFCYSRRFVKETFCLGDVVCIDVLYGHVLSRRRFVCAPI